MSLYGEVSYGILGAKGWKGYKGRYLQIRRDEIRGRPVSLGEGGEAGGEENDYAQDEGCGGGEFF